MCTVIGEMFLALLASLFVAIVIGAVLVLWPLMGD